MNENSAITRKGRKFDQVLEGARQVFMADGFEGASVDEIARVAGVSKATLYSYFSDKRLLFMEVARVECDRMAEEALNVVDMNLPPRVVAPIVAEKIVRFLLSDFSQRIFRICLAERDRFPELGRAFYTSGPEMGHNRLSDYLSQAVARGELQIDDVGMAADQFSELCKSKLWIRAMLGIQSDFSDDEIAYVVREAVETFMARYEVA
jgi:AcrR family transcriptional regulator